MGETAKRGRKSTVEGISGTNHGPKADYADQYRKTFVKCQLYEADKVELKKLLGNLDKIYRWFQDFIDAGYKVSVQYEPNNECYGVYATINDQTAPNYPYCLTARGPTVDGAIASLLYKHFNMLDTVWGTGQQAVENKDGWG